MVAVRTYLFLFWIFIGNKPGGVVYISYYKADGMMKMSLPWLKCPLLIFNHSFEVPQHTSACMLGLICMVSYIPGTQHIQAIVKSSSTLEIIKVEKQSQGESNISTPRRDALSWPYNIFVSQLSPSAIHMPNTPIFLQCYTPLCMNH